MLRRKDEAAYLLPPQREREEDESRSDTIFIRGEINVSGGEKTLILPERTEVIILLETSG